MNTLHFIKTFNLHMSFKILNKCCPGFAIMAVTARKVTTS